MGYLQVCQGNILAVFIEAVQVLSFWTGFSLLKSLNPHNVAGACKWVAHQDRSLLIPGIFSCFFCIGVDSWVSLCPIRAHGIPDAQAKNRYDFCRFWTESKAPWGFQQIRFWPGSQGAAGVILSHTWANRLASLSPCFFFWELDIIMPSLLGCCKN